MCYILVTKATAVYLLSLCFLFFFSRLVMLHHLEVIMRSKKSQVSHQSTALKPKSLWIKIVARGPHVAQLLVI